MDTLGGLPPQNNTRDAVHVAIVAVKAARDLMPGDHVSIDGSRQGKKIGIVDPFRDGIIKEGELFWLCLYPNTITGMRHHWTHPLFDGQRTEDKREESRLWLEEQCEPLNMTFSELTRTGGHLRGEYVLDNEADSHWSNISHEFWDHLERYLGTPIENRGGFTCSC